MSARTLLASRLGLAALMAVTVAFGQTTTGAGRLAGETPPDVAAKARVHFQRGRDLYQAGSYREAIGELEAAHSLDPRAKDLVFNLAVVNEKLGQIDAAIGYIHTYVDMDLDAQERSRADAYLKRLEGAKKEVEARAAVAPAPTATGPSPTPGGPEAPPPRGRIDAATVTAASFAAAGIALGTIFGIKAIGDQPKGFVSGKNGTTFATYLAEQQSAHSEAIVADVGLGVGVAAAAIAAYLYFGRTKNPPPRTETQVTETQVSIGPVTERGHGAVLVVGGTF